MSDITTHAFTEEAGKELGRPSEDVTSRMSTERCVSLTSPRRHPAQHAEAYFACLMRPSRRCAKLMAGAIWAKLPEVWIAKQPILFYTYLSQYAPSVFTALSKGAGRARVEALQRGDAGYDSISSVSATHLACVAMSRHHSVGRPSLIDSCGKRCASVLDQSLRRFECCSVVVAEASTRRHNVHAAYFQLSKYAQPSV